MGKSECIRIEADLKQIKNCRANISKYETSLTILSEVLSLTGNEVRLKILFLLSKESRLCVCDLSDILLMNISAISQHLRKLRDKGLIKKKREAQTIYYSLTEKYIKVTTPLFNLIEDNKVLEI